MSDERQAEREAVADEAAEDLEVSDEAADDVKGGLLRRRTVDNNSNTDAGNAGNAGGTVRR